MKHSKGKTTITKIETFLILLFAFCPCFFSLLDMFILFVFVSFWFLTFSKTNKTNMSNLDEEFADEEEHLEQNKEHFKKQLRYGNIGVILILLTSLLLAIIFFSVGHEKEASAAKVSIILAGAFFLSLGLALPFLLIPFCVSRGEMKHVLLSSVYELKVFRRRFWNHFALYFCVSFCCFSLSILVTVLIILLAIFRHNNNNP